MRILFLFSLISTSAFAGIFGPDDRIDTKYASAYLQVLAESVPALVQKNRIEAVSDKLFKLNGIPMTKHGLCSTELFVEEKNIANCSASFIGKDLVLTAAHCFDNGTYACKNYSVVFDYQRSEIPIRDDHFLRKDQIYSCKEIIYSKFDETMRKDDLAIIRLDREVEGRLPVVLDFSLKLTKGTPLKLIGYPMGISQKIVEAGNVSSVDQKNISFRHTLDSFSVNSGSPIFSEAGKQVGVLVRGSGANFDDNKDQGCSNWNVATKNDFSEANDLTTLKSVLQRLK